MFIVEVDKMLISLNDFNSILNLAKLASVKVSINFRYFVAIDVPEDLLNENRKWLDFKKGSIRDDTIGILLN